MSSKYFGERNKYKITKLNLWIDDGILIESDHKQFIPWREIIWVGEDMKEYAAPEIKETKKRIKRKSYSILIAIYVGVIAVAFLIRWLR